MTQTVITEKQFRRNIYELIIKLLNTSSSPDYSVLCQCLEHLNRYSDSIYFYNLIVSELLLYLVGKGNVENALQLAFDLYSNGNHQLLMPIFTALTEKNNPKNDVITNLINILNGNFAQDQYLSFLWKNNHSDMLLMKELKDGVEKSSSVLNHATIVYIIIYY